LKRDLGGSLKVSSLPLLCLLFCFNKKGNDNKVAIAFFFLFILVLLQQRRRWHKAIVTFFYFGFAATKKATTPELSSPSFLAFGFVSINKG
jgi:uncharacterized membrane protein YjjP (DUF1212 family)